MPRNTPLTKLPVLPRGIGLSKVIVVLVLAEIVNVWAFDVPPPGAGVNTVTVAVPATAMSAGVIAAVSWVAETRVVARFAPFQRTTELPTKLVPVTVNVNPGPPAGAEAGFSPVVVGTGLLPAVMVNVCALDVPPPGAGVNTVTAAVPATATSAAVIAAVSWVADPNVVARFAPFHRTTEPGTKLVPLTVSVNPGPPATVDAGLNPVVVGTRFEPIGPVTVVPPAHPAPALGTPPVSSRTGKTSE